MCLATVGHYGQTLHDPLGSFILVSSVCFPLCFSLYTHFTQDAMSHVLADYAKCNVYVMSWGIT